MILVDLPFEWPKQGQADDHFDIGETYGVQAAEIGDGERGGLHGANSANVQCDGRSGVKLRRATHTFRFGPERQRKMMRVRIGLAHNKLVDARIDHRFRGAAVQDDRDDEIAFRVEIDPA